MLAVLKLSLGLDGGIRTLELLRLLIRIGGLGSGEYRFSLSSVMWEMALLGLGGTGGEILVGLGGIGGAAKKVDEVDMDEDEAIELESPN